MFTLLTTYWPLKKKTRGLDPIVSVIVSETRWSVIGTFPRLDACYRICIAKCLYSIMTKQIQK